MTKADIVNEISSKTGLTKIETEVVINSLVSTVSKSLMRGERVDIRGFGSFYIKKREAREARNPATNQTIKLSERFIPYFKVSKLLKEKVNKTLLRGF